MNKVRPSTNTYREIWSSSQANDLEVKQKLFLPHAKQNVANINQTINLIEE